MRAITSLIILVIITFVSAVPNSYAQDEPTINICLRITDIPSKYTDAQVVSGVKAVADQLEKIGYEVKKVYANDDKTFSICLDLKGKSGLESLTPKTKEIEL